ncbi:MAG: DUF4190 domain-containing protein [Sandaracinaceae bacterium]
MHQPEKKKINDLALISVAGGALSWFMFPVVGAIVGIVAGHLARAKIRETGEDGDLFAILGMALGYAHILLTCAVFAFVILMYAGMFAFVGFAASQQ